MNKQDRSKVTKCVIILKLLRVRLDTIANREWKEFYNMSEEEKKTTSGQAKARNVEILYESATILQSAVIILNKSIK